MGSKRLPGKSLKKICGKPLIQWVIEGVLDSRLAEEVVLCTSENKENDSLIVFGRDFNIGVFRGSEDNVLARFIDAARVYKADTIVRVCADNPFVNGQEIDKLIIFFNTHKYDYAFNNIPSDGNLYPDGLGAEIFRLELLERIYEHCNDSEKEHVTSKIINNAEKFTIKTFKADTDLQHPEVKLDIDTAEDLLRITTLMESILSEGKNPRVARDVVSSYIKLFK